MVWYIEYPAQSIFHFTLKVFPSLMFRNQRGSHNQPCVLFGFVCIGDKYELTFLAFDVRVKLFNFKKAPVVEIHVVVAILPMGLHYPLDAPTLPVLRPSMLAVVPLFMVSDHFVLKVA